MKPLLVDPKTLFPSDAKSDPMVCWKCLKKCARWHVGLSPNDQPMCGMCFLYETPWGLEHAEQIEELVRATEESMGAQITEGGRLKASEADRIVSSVRFASSLGVAVRRLVARDENSGS